MKKSLLFGSVVAATMIFTGCAGQVTQMLNSGMGQQLVQGAVSNATESNATSAVSKATTKSNCTPRVSGGSVSFTSMFTKTAFNLLAEQALKSIDGMEDVKLPSKIMDTCVADERLKYVSSISNRYFENLNVVNEKILEALVETKEINQIKADIKDQKNIEDQAQLNEGIAENNEKIQEVMKNAKVKDTKKISEAQGIFFKTMPKYTALLIGWDKEIAEFGKDNPVWAVQNFSAVKVALTQLKTVAMIAVNGKTTMDKFIESNNIKIDTNAANRAASAMKKGNDKVIASSEKAFNQAF